MMEAMLLGLLVTPLVNWPVFVMLALARPAVPSRALWLVRWRSLALAILSTVYACFVAARYVGFPIRDDLAVLLLVLPVYLFTLINAGFLYFTLRKGW